MATECAARINTFMTPNHIVHDCPRAKKIFERLAIKLAFEGADCLDEVAWRHGIQVEELVAQLNRTLGNEFADDQVSAVRE